MSIGTLFILLRVMGDRVTDGTTSLNLQPVTHHSLTRNFLVLLH